MYNPIRKTDKATHQIHVRLNDAEFKILQEIMEKQEEYNNYMERKTTMSDTLKQGLSYAYMITCDDKYMLISRQVYDGLTKNKTNKSSRAKKKEK